MKNYLSIVLALASIGLVIALVVTKQNDTARHEADAGAITDFSNRLDMAETQFHMCNGAALVFSNSLNECRSAVATFSNQLTEAQSALALNAEQITNLDRHVAAVEAENQTLGRRVMDLTNQVAGLTGQIISTQASLVRTNNDLVQACKDYALLENRFRINVAERIVVERRFNNPLELQAQLQKLKKQPAGTITPESIYAGLIVEVKSNGACHVISPN